MASVTSDSFLPGPEGSVLSEGQGFGNFCDPPTFGRDCRPKGFGNRGATLTGNSFGRGEQFRKRGRVSMELDAGDHWLRRSDETDVDFSLTSGRKGRRSVLMRTNGFGDAWIRHIGETASLLLRRL